MRSWGVPVQIVEEEKVVGGRLTIRQTVYLFFVGPGFGGLMGLLIPLPWWGRLFLIVLGCLAGALFAFKHVHNLRLDTYLWLWWRWRRSRPLFLKGDE